VPAIGGTKVAGGLQMAGDQRRVFVNRVRVTLLDRERQAPMPLGAIRFEL
jgi:hypothetical protein